jgi:hypothetical protein
MDVLKEVRGAYISLLATAGIKAYDRFLPDDMSDTTYVIVSSQEDTEQIDKCDNGHVTFVSLDIIHRTINNSGGVQCDNIAEIVIPLVRNNPIPVPAGLTFITGSTRKIGDNTLDGFSDIYKVYRRILRFQHIIKEN